MLINKIEVDGDTITLRSRGYPYKVVIEQLKFIEQRQLKGGNDMLYCFAARQGLRVRFVLPDTPTKLNRPFLIVGSGADTIHDVPLGRLDELVAALKLNQLTPDSPAP